MAKRSKQHKTTHLIQARDGKVSVYCETCPWRDEVKVEGLEYVDAMQAIYKARDAHEANSVAPAERGEPQAERV